MTTQTLGIILLAIALVLGVILQIMPDRIEIRTKRYVRPNELRAKESVKNGQ